MLEELNLIYRDIKSLKENLIKLNKSRRTEKLLNEKLNEATLLYNRYLVCAETLDNKIRKCEYSSDDIIYSKEISIRIETLYNKIEQFCNSNIESQSTMEKFDLKTAVALLPVMNGQEDITKKLIDAIELYSSMISDESQKTLINFILKTRLSESAKLRLKSSYDTVRSLLSDMKEHLLTKMSSTAIHTQLIREHQSTSTIEDYGKRLESLFVNLTISQADGDSRSYEVLKPINEKLAINSFIGGLRNSNLRVILAAHNYTSLKDVIRAAKDQELTSHTPRSQSEESMYMGHRQKPGNFTGRFRGGSRGFANFRGSRGAGGNHHRSQPHWQNPGPSRQGNLSGGRTFYRGNARQTTRSSNTFINRGNRTRHIHFMNMGSENSNIQPPTHTNTGNTSESEFFRP